MMKKIAVLTVLSTYDRRYTFGQVLAMKKIAVLTVLLST